MNYSYFIVQTDTSVLLEKITTQKMHTKLHPGLLHIFSVFSPAMILIILQKLIILKIFKTRQQLSRTFSSMSESLPKIPEHFLETNQYSLSIQ